MDFFARQERARRTTALLVALFVLALVAIAVAVDRLVWLVLHGTDSWLMLAEFAVSPETAGGVRKLDPMLVHLSAAAITVLVIGLGSLYKIVRLRRGGGVIAESLGGVPVPPDTKDASRRMLRNVVEEIALASGLPVPELYVLEHEGGINAFAAGFTPNDAAIGVTRGCLERLSRDELQGVIAHETSHILNQDMRLNTTLVGILHGLLLLRILGRMVLPRRGFGSQGKQAFPLALVGAGLTAVGFLGVLFGRLIQAGVSRQREYLADASAVQFTRNPQGLVGALEKIARTPLGSRLESPHVDEVSHMLFGQGTATLFASHPPLKQRILALEPGYDTSRLALAPANALLAHAPLEGEVGASGLAGAAPPVLPEVAISPSALVAAVGDPTPGHLAHAESLLERLDPELEEALREREGCRFAVFCTLLSNDHNTLQKQLVVIQRQFGSSGVAKVEELLPKLRELGPSARLPLVELSAPVLRKLRDDDRARFVDLVDRLIETDGDVDLFEYAAAQVLKRQLGDAADRSSHRGQHATLAERQAEVQALLSALTAVGHRDPFDARAAYAAGMGDLGLDSQLDPLTRRSWLRALDGALVRLEELRPNEKRRLLEACLSTVSHDGAVTLAESEMLRAVCAALACPLPVLALAPG